MRIGWRAHDALVRSAGRSLPLAGFDGSAYRVAGGELVWIGPPEAPMHPRAVMLDVGERLRLEALVPWRPTLLPCDAIALREGSIALAAQLPTRPGFLLDAAGPHVRAFARAIDADDAQAACAAALPLLGLGPGLTPSGDDFVGAALFARRLAGMGEAWTRAADSLVDAARERTHALGAALFADLAAGQSFAALHRLADALAAREPALPAARALAAVGHSSGRDMLAGFLVGAAGSAAIA